MKRDNDHDTAEDQQAQAGQDLPDDLMTLAQAAKAFGVPQSSIYYWADKGMLESWKIGLGKGKLLISRAQLARLLEESKRIRPA